MMTLEQFRALADSYGADLQRWPQPLRPQARALLECSAEARGIIASARELDEAITAASSARSESLWSGGGSEAALVRLRNTVAARINTTAAAAAIAAAESPMRAARHTRGRVRWISLATAASVAIFAGVVLGIVYSPVAPHQDLLALLQPAPIQLLDD